MNCFNSLDIGQFGDGLPWKSWYLWPLERDCSVLSTFATGKFPFWSYLSLDILSSQFEWVLYLGIDCEHISEVLLSSYFLNGAGPGNHIYQIWCRVVLLLFYFLRSVGWRGRADKIIQEWRPRVMNRFHFAHYFR